MSAITPEQLKAIVESAVSSALAIQERNLRKRYRKFRIKDSTKRD